MKKYKKQHGKRDNWRVHRGDQHAPILNMSEKCVMAMEVEALVRREAMKRNLTLRVNTINCGNGSGTMHWMFDCGDSGKRVMDYWPGTGTFQKPTGESGKAKNPWQALEKARADARFVPPAPIRKEPVGEQPCRPAADEDPPETLPRHESGHWLNGAEAYLFDRAVRDGVLTLPMWLPASSRLPDAYRAWCKAAMVAYREQQEVLS